MEERRTLGATARSARSPPAGSNIEQANYHRCLGYFSVRYLDAAGKWAMLYTCGNDEQLGRPLRTDARGVFLRTATLPWGPWSPPSESSIPPRATASSCIWRSPCPAQPRRGREAEKTKGVLVREPGGEYAPFLLPSRYAKLGPGGQVDLYYLLSTWNPYQVVLMKTRVGIR